MSLYGFTISDSSLEGGHTSEMLQMLKGLDAERYEPRTYIVSEGDQFSAAKATELESASSFPPVRCISMEE